MSENWKNWCRLCGKKDPRGEDLISKMKLSRKKQEIAKKYFSIKLLPLEGKKSSVCQDCYNFLTKLEDFGNQCCKVDKMFNALISNKDLSKDDVHLQDIRIIFNVIPGLEFPPLPEDSDKDITMSYREATKEEAMSGRIEQNITERLENESCEKISGSSSVLKDHNMAINSQDKPPYGRLLRRTYPIERLYKPCPHCNKLFTSNGAIKSHIISAHTDEKSFICEICGKAFKQYSTLFGHKIIHSDERPYKCPRCPATFKARNQLKNHRRLHKGIKYPCSQCDAKLTSKAGLKMHQLVHSDVKKYKCKRCGEEFKRSCALKKHLIKHMGLRLYKCQFCGNMYTDGSSCRKHKIKYHPVELAEFEASGQTVEITRAPRLEWLQLESKSTVEDDTNNEN